LIINLINKTDRELKIEIRSEGHTLCNLLQQTLLKNNQVEMAGYHVPHRLVDSSVLYIRTKSGESPAHAILEASKELKNETDEFRKIFEKALKEYETKSKP
jgi:DNA-directed RNA polymerase subunit L